MEVKRLPGQFGEAGLEHIITLLPQFKNSLPDLLEQERLIDVYFLKRSYLSDPSPIIGNACHSLTNSLTNSLPFSKLD